MNNIKYKNQKKQNNNKKRNLSCDNKRNTNNNIIKIENIDPNKVNNFNYYFKNLDIYTKYIISLRNGNNIYYYCNKKRNGCFGKIKFSLKEKNWYILKECDINIMHNTSNFEIFLKII